MKSRLPLALAAAMLVAASGCVPSDVVWLEDSSGFVFLKDAKTLACYDLARQAERTIVTFHEDVRFQNLRPAVSPDGKRVAVVTGTQLRETQRVEIALYDRQGQQLGLPAQTSWPQSAPPEFVPYRTYHEACWSPDGRRLLVSAPRSLVLYELASRSLQTFDGLRLHPTASLGLSPFTPDGKGFLASKPIDELKGTATFVDFEGWVHAFRGSQEAQQAESHIDLSQAPYLWPMASWRRGLAVVRLSDGKQLTLDPVRREASLKDAEATVRALYLYAQHHDCTVLPLAEDLVLRAARPQPDAPRFQVTSIEVVVPSLAKSKAIANGAERDSVAFVPAPDRRHTIVFYRTKEGQAEHLLLVNQKGEVLRRWDR
jgi:hypothetical protein